MIERLDNRFLDLITLDNTYIFFSTDDGYHIGQNRLQPSKQCHYQEYVNSERPKGKGTLETILGAEDSYFPDIVPLIIRVRSG